MKIGSKLTEEGIEFSVWAPNVKSLALMHDNKRIPMKKNAEEIYSCTVAKPRLPFDYQFEIDNDRLRPDPRSRWQPKGVHGPSRMYDYRFHWTDDDWKGIDLAQYIIYELHIGTFTPEGTFEAAISKLPYLKELGITAVELMPVVEFPGARNWGYDQAHIYAPHNNYGGPEALKKFIDAAHHHGLAVVLDVIYNHLGPEGNYLADYGPYFTDRYKTPWGQALNYDGEYSDHVRDYFISNALYWLEEFHVDALRLDAVHAIYDFGAYHILAELADQFHDKAKALGRKAYLIAESDLNDVRIIQDRSKGGYDLDAQWNDDFHHALHAWLTGKRWRYFSDFGDIDLVEKALVEGFVYDWKNSAFRKKHFGSTSKDLPGEKFVGFLQNHDQIANASLGKRLGEIVGSDQQKLAAALVILSAKIPLLFMGEEWKASTPFYFFTSFEDKGLSNAVKEGYCKEFELKEDEGFDPQDPGRFEASRLKWSEKDSGEHREMLEFYTKLITIRKKYPHVKIEREGDDLRIIRSALPDETVVLHVDLAKKSFRLIDRY